MLHARTTDSKRLLKQPQHACLWLLIECHNNRPDSKKQQQTSCLRLLHLDGNAPMLGLPEACQPQSVSECKRQMQLRHQDTMHRNMQGTLHMPKLPTRIARRAARGNLLRAAPKHQPPRDFSSLWLNSMLPTTSSCCSGGSSTVRTHPKQAAPA